MKKNNTKAQNFNEAMFDFFSKNYINRSLKEYAENTKDILDFLRIFAIDVTPSTETPGEEYLKAVIADCRAKLYEALLAYRKLDAVAEQMDV